MKNITTLATTAIIFLGLGTPFTARCQTYEVSRTIGQIDFNFDGTTGPIGGTQVPGLTFNETVTINPTTQTIDQSGSFILPGESLNMTASETQTIPPVFPFPPQTVSGDYNIGLTFNTTTVAFDTGPQALTFAGQFYSFKASTILNVPMSLSYTLTTGGQTYTASLNDNSGFALVLDGEVDTDNYPSSISIPENASLGPVRFGLADFTAADGFQADLVLTPEPSTWLIGGMGSLALFLFRRRN